MTLADKVRRRIDRLHAGEEASEDACSLSHRPLSERELDAVETGLGFQLPAAVREIYRAVGNGGFGPAYGLLGLRGGMRQEDGLDALGMYADFRKRNPDDPHWDWPAGLLPLVHLGCAMYFCVDCTRPEGPVIWFEPNPHVDGEPWADSFIPLRMSFAEMMERWAEGADAMEFIEATSGHSA